jgi:Sulfatase
MPAAAALNAAPTGKSSAVDRVEWRAFATWLGCWIVLPNLPFLPVTLLGGPPRYVEIMLCGIVGLVVRRQHLSVRIAAFAALLAYLVIAFISRMFNMAPTMLLSVASLVFDLQPQASPEYAVGAGLLGLTLAAAVWLLRKPGQFAHPRLVVGAAALVALLAGGDHALSQAAMGSYGRIASPENRFDSAASQVRLLAGADGRSNLLVVIVEALGEPRDPALRRKLDQLWLRPELAGRYTMSRGVTEFYGSTTSGEMRELCQRWGDYPEIEGPQTDCLPAILRQRGYSAQSVHAFQPGFFERSDWYPLIGFERMTFGQELLDRGAGYCPNVFPGACDRDVPRFIAEELRRPGQPKFIYWLTLNSHLPVLPNRELGTQQCAQLGAVQDRDFPMVCRLFAVWEDTADALTAMLAEPGLPPTDVLIVGDHVPPFTQQSARVQFDAAHVPWYYLRARRPAAAQDPL